MNRKHSYRILVGLWLFSFVLIGCSPTQTQNEMTLDGPASLKLVKELTATVETASATDEEEGFVLNHFSNLWHYMQVSSRTTVTFKRVYYSGFGKETETIHADIDLPSLGMIQITVVDNDGSETPGVDEGNIKFTMEVDSPEKGTATGEFFPFGGAYGDVTVPPSYNMKLPSSKGEYFVPAGGLIDYTKRHIKSEALTPALQKLMTDVYEYGMKEVPRAG